MFDGAVAGLSVLLLRVKAVVYIVTFLEVVCKELCKLASPMLLCTAGVGQLARSICLYISRNPSSGMSCVLCFKTCPLRGKYPFSRPSKNVEDNLRIEDT